MNADATRTTHRADETDEQRPTHIRRRGVHDLPRRERKGNRRQKVAAAVRAHA